MIKKALKYIAIVLVNWMILLFLLYAWVDDFELEFNSGVFFSEYVDITVISLLSVLILRIAVFVFQRQKITSLKLKIGLSIIIVILIHSSFYIDYGKKVYQHQFVNKELRERVVSKVIPYDGSWFGMRAENLTSLEYLEITKIKWFPKVPKEAQNISYDYEYEGFLPDYSFSLSYDLPMDIAIDTMKYKDGTFSKSRYFEIVGNKKRVTYTESLW
jgi:hypothetical protein